MRLETDALQSALMREHLKQSIARAFNVALARGPGMSMDEPAELVVKAVEMYVATAIREASDEL